MISKELLSAVLKEKRIILDYEISISKNEIHYGHIDIEEDGFINIYELAFRTRDYFKIRSKHLSLNQNIDDIFKEANSIYESLSQ